MSDTPDPEVASTRRRPLAFPSRAAAAPPAEELSAGSTWKLMISDDDDDVHVVSRLLLKDFSFEGRRLSFLSARTAEETRTLLSQHPDTAVLLLDVVMESTHAGLAVVHHIRNELKNPFVRIILRTGQPGQAPERQVVEEYDINDYKEKTELTAQKLITTVMAALRAYRDIQTLETSRKGLERIIASSSTLFQPQSPRRFSAGALNQLAGLIESRQAGAPVPVSGLAARRFGSGFKVLAAIGDYAAEPEPSIPPEVAERLRAAVGERRCVIGLRDFVGWFSTSTGTENVLYLRSGAPFDAVDSSLFAVFGAMLGIAFDNVYLNREIADTQAELVQRLSDVVETRSAETGQHTARVGRVAQRLAQKLGLDDSEADLLRVVAPMHDLGKVGIPDAILNKPGRLTPEEYELVKTHAQLGYDILKGSKRRILRAAALVCLQHHEHWAGTGYPRGLVGEEIDIMGRIVGLADVFDAIAHDRPYKVGWPPERVLDYIRGQRAKQFDPELVDVFVADFEEFVALGRELGEDDHAAVALI
ncbi:MAG: DUF3369 domain-containing protein [Azospirillum sp.]|nr:DUF3369 domain-containing protein [Azospirillum sp.]